MATQGTTARPQSGWITALARWFGSEFRRGGRGTDRGCRRLRATAGRWEQLERRDLLATIPFVVPFTEMTQVAEQFQAPDGPTALHLNFDGYSDKGVRPFAATTDDRHRDIQEILFRTSQLFAPFDVEVQRIVGNGNLWAADGATTIFIGDKLGNSTFWEGDGGSYIYNRTRAYADVDYPSPLRGILHQPNSDEYNTGFVDPVSFETGSSVGGAVLNYDAGDNTSISRTIAHEAGHTFGLAHVLSAPLGTDVMSYNSANISFENQSFNTTNLNNNGTTTEPTPSLQPMWAYFQFVNRRPLLTPAPLVTQNSFTYLEAVLGEREVGSDYANVVDSNTTSPFYVDGNMPQVTLGYDSLASVNRRGDYDVFELTVGATDVIKLDVLPIDTSNLDPVVMVFDDSGSQLLAFDDDGGPGYASQLVFQALAGTSYKVVLGGYNGVSQGVYNLTVTPAVFTVNPLFGDFDLHSEPNPWTSANKRPTGLNSVTSASQYLAVRNEHHLVDRHLYRRVTHTPPEGRQESSLDRYAATVGEASIARAIARGPRVILMDEPVSALDHIYAGDIADLVYEDM